MKKYWARACGFRFVLTVGVLLASTAAARVNAQFVQVVPHDVHVVAIDGNGVPNTWGGEGVNALANGGLGIASGVPRPVPGLPTIVDVAAGGQHSLFLTAGGAVWAAGNNLLAEVGDGTFTPRPTPVLTQITSGAIDVTAGFAASWALLSSGTVVGWGSIRGTQAGASPIIALSPVQVPLGVSLTSVRAGTNGAVGLASNGDVWEWGEAFAHTGLPGPPSFAPQQVIGLSNITKIATGLGEAMALDANGNVFLWGTIPLFSAGIAVTPSLSTLPGVPPIVDIAAGFAIRMLLDQNGQVWTFGSNQTGQLGFGDYTPRTLPALVPGLSGIVGIATHRSTCFAWNAQGETWSWGDQGLITLAGQPQSAQLLGNGGLGSLGTTPERVRVLGAGPLPAVQGVGTACLGSGLVLTARSSPSLGTSAFHQTINTNLPVSLFAAPGAALSTPWTLSNGCSVYLDPAGLNAFLATGIFPLPATGPFALIPNTPGQYFELGIPSDPFLAGMTFSFQAAAITAMAPGGFVLSNALEITVN